MTLRELVAMAEGRRRDSWERTSFIVCKLHNIFRGKHDPARSPDFFNPMHKAPRPTIDDIKNAFIGQN